MRRLEEENSLLKAEVERLKKQLVTMEIRNGGIILTHILTIHHICLHTHTHTLKYPIAKGWKHQRSDVVLVGGATEYKIVVVPDIGAPDNSHNTPTLVCHHTHTHTHTHTHSPTDTCS